MTTTKIESGYYEIVKDETVYTVTKCGNLNNGWNIRINGSFVKRGRTLKNCEMYIKYGNPYYLIAKGQFHSWM